MNLNLKEAYTQHLPNVLSPTTLNQTIAEKAKTLAEELNLPEVCLQPITDEELRLSKYLSQPPPPQTPRLVSPLATVYPTENIFKDTSIQTTPRKKVYYIEEQTITDYNAGQPIEDICHTLRSTTMIEGNNMDEGLLPSQFQDDANGINNRPLKFVNAQPKENDEIDSFLWDFKKAKDPLSKSNIPPPPQSSSSKSENESSNGSSSEWEFLDN